MAYRYRKYKTMMSNCRHVLPIYPYTRRLARGESKERDIHFNVKDELMGLRVSSSWTHLIGQSQLDVCQVFSLHDPQLGPQQLVPRRNSSRFTAPWGSSPSGKALDSLFRQVGCFRASFLLTSRLRPWTPFVAPSTDDERPPTPRQSGFRTAKVPCRRQHLHLSGTAGLPAAEPLHVVLFSLLLAVLGRLRAIDLALCDHLTMLLFSARPSALVSGSSFPESSFYWPYEKEASRHRKARPARGLTTALPLRRPGSGLGSAPGT